MLRIPAALWAACLIVWPAPAAAQRWNDARTLALVEQATDVRARQLADTGLVDYRARANGFLAFLAQIGEGFTEPPRIVKADQLALEVYWRTPDFSKQRIIGRRDTLLFPTDIDYHTDHLGIIQNDFPEIIRLGDGDEVSDVPHPLSPLGLTQYDFAISDSLQIRLPDRVVDVIMVRVRPRDDRQPRVIGAVYIDRDQGAVVRMAFNFTRAAYVDRYLEDLSIVLENGLVDGRFWLPSRQEIEIRRTGTWLDYPARGIIRGRWEICCYQTNLGIDPSFFRGPEIVSAPPQMVRGHAWEGRILDSLPPEIRTVRPEDVRRVQEEARALVRADALARTRTTSLAARRASDFVRVNRVEGFALGAGVVRRLGAGLRLEGGARFGFADEAWKARGLIGWRDAAGRELRAYAHRSHLEAGDVPEVSLLRNSFAAQELGSDYTQPYGMEGLGLGITLGPPASIWRFDLEHGDQYPLSVHAEPERGRFAPTIPAWHLTSRRLTAENERPTFLGPLETEVRWRAQLRLARLEPDDAWPPEGPAPLPPGGDVPREEPLYLARLSGMLEVDRPFAAGRLVLRTTGAVLMGGSHVPQELVRLGGPTTGPGYGFHEFVGTAGASQRVEFRAPVPFVPIRLGRFGRSPATMTLAPYGHLVAIGGRDLVENGIFPSAGIGALTLFDLIRFDVARGLRAGRWTFSVDVARELWPIL